MICRVGKTKGGVKVPLGENTAISSNMFTSERNVRRTELKLISYIKKKTCVIDSELFWILIKIFFEYFQICEYYPIKSYRFEKKITYRNFLKLFSEHYDS